MDPVRKQRRIGIASVIAVLVIVCVWWTVVVPRAKHYGTSKSENKLKETLQTIKPPARARLVDISTFRNGPLVLAMGTYSIDSDSDYESVKTHYREELARHGLSFRGENKDPGSRNAGISFSGPEYNANLTCIHSEHPMSFMITLFGTYPRD